MKNSISIIFFLFAISLLFTVFPPDLAAQQTGTDLRSQAYTKAIDDIIIHSEGRLGREAIIKHLSALPDPCNPSAVDTSAVTNVFIVYPEVVLVSHDGNESALFYYYMSPQPLNTVLIFDFSNTPDWVDTSSLVIDFVAKSFTIDVFKNTELLARLAPFDVIGLLEGAVYTCTAYILQAPAPQAFIFVSPSYLAVPPEGGTTAPFTVTHLNLENGWEAILTDDWLEVDSATLSSNSISFNISPNTDADPRVATIQIRAVGNPDVFDNITIYQHTGQQNYLFAAPVNNYLNPSGGELQISVFTNLDLWNAEIVQNPAGMIAGLLQNPAGDTLTISVNPNNDGSQRLGIVSISGGAPLLSETINIFQSGAYLILNPSQKIVPCAGSVFGVEIIKSGVDEVEISGSPDWITVNNIDNESLLVTVSENPTGIVRTGSVYVSSLINPLIFDSLQVIQYSCSQAYILLSPEAQIANWNDTTLANPFIISYNNIGIPGVSTSAGWLDANISADSVFVTLDTNLTGELRMAEVTVFDTENPLIFDKAHVIQGSTQTYILITPGFQSVPASGGATEPYTVFTNNVENWEVWFEEQPVWITDIQISSNAVVLNLAANDTGLARQATFRVRDTSDPARYGEAVIFQEAGSGKFLFAAPREKQVPHTGNPAVDFQITAVNIETWVVDISTVPAWITVNSSDQSTLSLNVSENNLTETRVAMIRIHDSSDLAINDSVYIYQYSAGDSYLLVSPKEQVVSFTGNSNVVFQVTPVNISGWQYDPATVPSSWITVTNSGGSTLNLNVSANANQEIRQATIRLFAIGQPEIEEFVTVYQQAAPSAYLFAAPRVKSIPHEGQSNVDFTVIMVNLDGWEFVDTEPYEDWIDFQNIGDSIIRLDIAANTLPETRFAEIIIQSIEDEAITDTVYVYQFSSLDSYLLLSPREQSVSHYGGTIDFQVSAVNVDNWVVDAAAMPEWITPGSSTADTLRLVIGLNTTQSTRMAWVHVEDESNPAVADSVAVYQFASSEPFILISPRSKQVGHNGTAALDFNVTRVQVSSWEFTNTAPYEDWIDFYNIGDSIMRLAIDTNFTLQTRLANILIQATEDNSVKDSATVFQFSGLDRYIIAEPRELMAKSYETDTLVFSLLAVNVSSLAYEVIFSTDPDMIDDEGSFINNDQLTIIVNPNESFYPREARIRIFDAIYVEVADTVSIYQSFPGIILRPASLDGISWAETIFKVNTISNVSEFLVSKGDAFDWYQLSKDAVSWSDDPVTLGGNDSLYVRVQENTSAFQKRSSYLSFKVGGETINQFWFSQDARPGSFYTLSGGIFIDGDLSKPLAGVQVAIYDAIKTTNANGLFMHENIPENWTGTITPLIDASLPFPYYFYPPIIEISGSGVTGDTVVGIFSAFSLQPNLSIFPKTVTICTGHVLMPGDPNYPNISLNNTFGPTSFLWSSDPHDDILAQNPFVMNPQFGPLTTTTYRLEVDNLSRIAVDSFTIVVNPLPSIAQTEGPFSVCRNQAGVVYQVSDPQPGVSYLWKLEETNPGGAIVNGYNPLFVSGNIAIVNWGNAPGTYLLTLLTYNQWECAAIPQTILVEINNNEASPPTTVERKRDDNMLFTTDTLAARYQWGWFTKSQSGQLGEEYLIPGKNQWYCRLPEGHVFNTQLYYYFVITHYDDYETCVSRSFYNAPVGVEEFYAEPPGIFPNPGNGNFTLIINDPAHRQGSELEIYTTTGQLVYKKHLHAAQTEYRIDLLKEGITGRGIYILVVRTPVSVNSSKLIIH